MAERCKGRCDYAGNCLAADGFCSQRCRTAYEAGRESEAELRRRLVQSGELEGELRVALQSYHQLALTHAICGPDIGRRCWACGELGRRGWL